MPEPGDVSKLRDQLLASYPDAAYFGAPVVAIDRENQQPAWYWIADAVNWGSQWWPALGIALQHAARDGGDLARRALVDAIGGFRDTMVLTPWTAPLAAAFPDLRTGGTTTGMGEPDFTLASIVREQAEFVERQRTSSPHVVFLQNYGPDGGSYEAPFDNPDDLRAILRKTARDGRFPDAKRGPWSWLRFECLVNRAWLRPALLDVYATLGEAEDTVVYAALDWLTDGFDAWRFAPALERLAARPPAWWTRPPSQVPEGWPRPPRNTEFCETCGEAVEFSLSSARFRLANPPVIDLPVLYGPPSLAECP